MTAKVILNPYSGRWRALARKPEAEAALHSAGLEYDLAQSDGPGHGEKLAEQAVRDGFCPIVAAGGDGTYSEIMNGMMRAFEAGAPEVPLGLLPMGTANDLVENLKLPVDLNEAARLIATGKTRRMDLCMVNGRYFDNNAAIGLEPYITLIHQKIHRLKGNLRYLVATLRGVMDKPQWTMRLEWEGGNYQGPISLVTVGNCPRTGGLFYVTPHADPFDGKLTFVYAYLPTRLQILRVLPRLMKPGPGNYTEHPAVHEVHSPWLRVHSEQLTPMHADGEIQSTGIQDLEYKVWPARIQVICNW